jgi:hypothetical protein
MTMAEGRHRGARINAGLRLHHALAGPAFYGNDMTPTKMIGRRFGRLVVTSETDPYISPRGQIHRCFRVCQVAV